MFWIIWVQKRTQNKVFPLSCFSSRQCEMCDMLACCRYAVYYSIANIHKVWKLHFSNLNFLCYCLIWASSTAWNSLSQRVFQALQRTDFRCASKKATKGTCCFSLEWENITIGWDCVGNKKKKDWWLGCLCTGFFIYFTTVYHVILPVLSIHSIFHLQCCQHDGYRTTVKH